MPPEKLWVFPHPPSPHFSNLSHHPPRPPSPSSLPPQLHSLPTPSPPAYSPPDTSPSPSDPAPPTSSSVPSQPRFGSTWRASAASPKCALRAQRGCMVWGV